tara:strand:+ start:39 stop:965 length:927 start_codon:yes stop_codon:yes gene_type:complete
MSSNFVIADWLVHGGHQYEFFKANGRFLCTNPDKSKPDYNILNRPKNPKVTYVTEEGLLRANFNIAMIRAGVKYDGTNKAVIKNRAAGIAVIQTHKPFKVPDWVRCVVWNSDYAMRHYRRQLPYKKHFYIPHGFDPDEFANLGLDRNERVLSAASLFEKRNSVMGFSDWRWVADRLGICDVIGHGNPGLKECIGNFSLEQLVKKYNEYSVFLNTTTRSAMPRVRGEALMCGTPVITTENYGIGKYLVHGKSCFFANKREDMLTFSRKLLGSKSMQVDFGEAGREVAIKHFNIKEYLDRWNNVFEEAVK